MGYDFSTKDEMLEKLRGLTEVPDYDGIRLKKKIKDELLHCPELLYAINDKELEKELFDEDGNLNVDEDGEPLGDWDSYFGPLSHIRDYLFFPDVQTDAQTLVTYQVGFREEPRYNDFEKLGLITFNIFVYHAENFDKSTGIARHDLIGGILREKFNWSNIFGTKCKIVQDSEGSTDGNYVMRTIVFQQTTSNSLVKTTNGETGYINKKFFRD